MARNKEGRKLIFSEGNKLEREALKQKGIRPMQVAGIGGEELGPPG